ncbi:hypothetical protein TNCV_825561 [Trichonephila clavipes]|nr:hypothetical protein TNCV_825561 [Trichonephila clavipes]
MPISLPGSVLMSSMQPQTSMVCREGILYKGTLARYSRCSRPRRIDEAYISTPAAVDQRAANCLEKLYDHSQPCGEGVDRRVLT